jgi:hypothetical protein
MAMTSLWTFIRMLFLFAGASGAEAQGSDVDWKLYGGIGPPVGEESRCFYDAKGLTQQLAGHIRVWTKCLLEKDLDATLENDLEGKRTIAEATAKKVARYYVPPIATIWSTDASAAMRITAYEEVADIAFLQPQSEILYELNCPERMLRELSISLNTNGQLKSSKQPSDWRHVPPEGNASLLLKILCQPP